MKTRNWLSCIAVCALVACGSTTPAGTPKKEPKRLDLTLLTSKNLNRDGQGRSSPLLIKVYELKSAAAFDEADFFDLQKSDKTVLQADLLVKNEYILKPGSEERIYRESNSETQFLGIVAEYKDLPSADWRVTYKLTPAPEEAWYRMVMPMHKVKLHIEFEGNHIQVTELNVTR